MDSAISRFAAWASAPVLLLLSPALVYAQARVQAEAIAGKPFGVGVITVQAPLGQRPLGEPGEGQVSLEERAGRAVLSGV